MSDEDDIQTQMMTKAKWLPPVERVDQLPIEGVVEGTRCFVDPDDAAEEEIWVFQGGAWIHVDTL